MQTKIHQIVTKTQNWVFVGLLITALLPGTPTKGDELSEIRDQMATLQQRLETLERAKSPPAHVSTSILQASINRKGLILEDQGNFTFRIRPRIQIDGHWFTDGDTGNNEFLLRRVRPVFQGDAGPVSWRFMPELAGTVRIVDAWADFAFNDTSLLRAGKLKQVVGFERLQSFSQLLFMERGLPSSLTPVRDIGLEYHGSFASGTIDTTLGIYNGVLDETDLSTNTNLDGDDVDLGVRIAFSPWLQGDNSSLRGLTFGFAATAGNENTVIDDADRDRRIRYRSSGLNTFFRYNNGVTLEGERARINGFLSWYHGPLGILAEWIRSSYDLNYHDSVENIATKAWTLQTGWIVTGEAASCNGIRPKHPITESNGLGAIELGLRLHQLEVDDKAFIDHSGIFFAHSKAVQKATGYGAAINWYLTDNLRLAANYEIMDFSGLGADRATEKALLTRMQIDF